MGKRIDPLALIGSEFGHWLVISAAPSDHRGKSQLRCRCTGCNDQVERDVRLNDLRTGRSQSCGCRRVSGLLNAVTKHGHSPCGARSITLKSWKGLLHRYGERVVQELRELSAFIAAVGERPSKAHHLRVLDTRALIITASELRWELRRSTTIPKNVARAARRVAEAEARDNASG